MTLEIHADAQGLIFDIDGTLANTMPIHYRAWAEAGRQFGFVYTENLFYQFAGMPSHAIVRALNEMYGYTLDPEFIHLEKKKIFLSMIDTIEPIAPVLALARKSFGRLPMSLGTGENRDVATMVIQAIGAEDLFEIYVTADDITRPKPDPETFLICASKMGIAPKQCQVFEDGDPGLAASRSAGMITTDVRPFLIN